MAAPSPPESPQYTAPTSPLKRRRFFQITDDNAGEMSIEDYIYRTDSFRSSSARMKFPLPLEKKQASPAYTALTTGNSTFRRHITQIMISHGIELASCNFMYQAKPEYPNGGDQWILTLRLTVHQATRPSTSQWSPARRAVKAFLDTSNTTTAEVEIIDLKQAFEPSIFPIAPNDSYIKTYESCRHSILTHIQEKIGYSWSSICLYRIGRNLQRSKYAIVISVLPLTVHDWSQLSLEILGIVTSHKQPHQSFQIIFVPGTCDMGAPVEDDSAEDDSAEDAKPRKHSAAISLMNQLTRYPEVGSSLCVAGKLSSATLGGFVTLTKGDKEFSGFITNSHVVEPGDWVPENIRDEFYQRGVTVTTPAESTKRATMQFPSTTDFEKTRNELKDTIKEVAGQIRTCEDEMAEKLEIGELKIVPSHILFQSSRIIIERIVWLIYFSFQGMKVGREKQSITNAQSYLDRYLTEMKICEQLPESLGRTTWASGRAVNHRDNMIDVAIVEWESSELKSHAAKGNKLPSGSDHRFKGQSPNDYKENFDTNGGINVVGPTICGMTDVKKGEWYFKIGRTTGLTTGVCHGTEAFVQIHDSSHFTRTKWSADGKPGTYETLQYTTEFVIITSKFNTPDTSQAPFNLAGDSGSLLINRFGEVAGLLFGSIRNRCGPPSNQTNYSANTGIATTMSRIQEHLTHTAPGMTIRFTNTVEAD